MHNSKPILSLVLCLALLTAPEITHAKIITVTNSGDAQDPPRGSFREAIEKLAEAGDTIVFEGAFTVTLQNKIEIPSFLNGLTIRGPAAIASPQRKVFEVWADNVTIENITFIRIHVFTAASHIDLTGGGVSGFSLINCRFNVEGSVSLDQARNSKVTDNTFDVEVFPGEQVPIQTRGTVACEISRNTVKSRGKFAIYDIDDSDSEELTVTENTLTAGMSLWPFSGRVVNNTVDGDSGIDMHYPDAAGSGHIDVLRNKAKRLELRRTDATIAENIIRPVGGREIGIYVRNFDPWGATGPILISDNDVSGGRSGIVYSESDPPRSAPAEISENKINQTNFKGIVAGGLRKGKVTDNMVTECGTGTSGVGIHIYGTKEDGTVVQRNRVTSTKGVGIRFEIDHELHALENTVSEEGTTEGISFLSGQGRLIAKDNRLFKNGRNGIIFGPKTSGELKGGEIYENKGAGIFLHPTAEVWISQVSFRENSGPGIDLAPPGVTPNPEAKFANRDLDWPEPLIIAGGKLRGFTIPFGIVEVFQIESGSRIGNPENGEGEVFAGSVIADGLGFFTWPPEGVIQCPPPPLLTLTVTTPGDNPVTSEFSPSPKCELGQNFAPVIGPVESVTTPQDTKKEVAAVIGDLETDSENLTVTASSSDPAIAMVSVNVTGSTRIITVIPTGTQSGTVTVTVNVTDPGHPLGTDPKTTTITFQVEVTPVADPEPPPDPGFPFVDMNNDGAYTPGLDLGKPEGLDIVSILSTDGALDVTLAFPGAGIVVPPSTGALDLDECMLGADGRVEIGEGVHITTREGTLTINGGVIVIGHNVHLSSGSDLIIEAHVGALILGDYVHLNGGSVILNASNSFALNQSFVRVGSSGRLEAETSLLLLAAGSLTVGEQTWIAAPTVGLFTSIWGIVAAHQIHVQASLFQVGGTPSLVLTHSWVHGGPVTEFPSVTDLTETRFLP